MELSNMWVMDIVGPAILLIVLIWLVIRADPSRSSDDERTDQASRDVCNDEEQRRRNGIGKL